ncbi:MAG TPA: NTP transferase domain-containing protein, partial [Rubrivivax sp.]|nr:NTP transferase domain-containing protein [Rubrivivax sp.]
MDQDDGVGAVVLAAGAGERLGRRPKCLLELDGVPRLARLLDALAAAGVAPVVVVSGHHAGRVEPLAGACGGGR